MPKKQVYHINDRVKIVNPEEFERCGYPLTTQIVKDTLITKEQKDKINDLLTCFKLNTPIYSSIIVEHITDNKYYQEILQTLARGVLCQNKWGGNEKKIYTKRREELKGREGCVISKKVKRTGFYEPAASYQGYYDDYPEHEPAYLAVSKSHVILELELCNNTDNRIVGYETIWIEEKNVELVKE